MPHRVEDSPLERGGGAVITGVHLNDAVPAVALRNEKARQSRIRDSAEEAVRDVSFDFPRCRRRSLLLR